ncbi:MAG TPA: hypothetical protein VKE26_06145 [Xanthobacteraceae bacterium]|nr:hypothetical protein [Xanthobacteraceae bacterium]
MPTGSHRVAGALLAGRCASRDAAPNTAVNAQAASNKRERIVDPLTVIRLPCSRS